ncbi:hypothetical protein ACIRD2_16170 [Streptomyces sp. NPDC093595]|uniref:hypothetical protein n=1 Tax=Streptomyces sp. NPDC093595 TaxID=3366045 RepID=UPI003800A5BE
MAARERLSGAAVPSSGTRTTSPEGGTGPDGALPGREPTAPTAALPSPSPPLPHAVSAPLTQSVTAARPSHFAVIAQVWLTSRQL